MIFGAYHGLFRFPQRFLVKAAMACMICFGWMPEASAQQPGSSDSIRTQWSGYLKHMHTAIYQPTVDEVWLDGLVQNRINFSAARTNSPWSVYAGLRTRMFYGDYFELDTDRGTSIHDKNNDYLPLSFNAINGDHMLVNSYLDRLYIQWSRNDWEVRLGRQRINWGINTFWNPNDLFNSFDFTDFDYEERPGSDALRVTWYTGPVSRLEGAIKMADNLDDVTMAMLYRWNMGSFDFQVIGGKYRKNLAVGGGWSGYLSDIGFKGELMYFDSYDSGIANTFNITTGFDYLFGSEVMAGLGYLYNGSGTLGQGSNLFNFQLSARNLYPYRHAVYGQINVSITPLLSGGAMVVYSPVETNPLFLSPSFSYSLSQNWDLDLVSQIFAAESSPINLNVYAFFLRTKWSF